MNVVYQMKYEMIRDASFFLSCYILSVTYLSYRLPGWNCETPTYLRRDVPFKISRLGSS